MLKNYFLTAWRHILKNKLYAAINILGLVIGLTIYIFGSLLSIYEQTYDMFYENSDRIYTVGSIFSPTANIGVGETDGVYTAVAPFIETDASEVEAVARTVRREYLLTIDEDSYYQDIRFVDTSFTTIFDFNYVEGDDSALDDPTGMIITRSVAEKYFGESPALGRTLTLDHNVSLHITAVVQDLPRNTHLNSTVMGNAVFEVVASLAALERAADYDPAGNWNNLSGGDLTYILLPQGKSRVWLQSKLDGIYERHFPEDNREFITGFRVRPLQEANTVVWDMVGIPIIESVQLLALLVLVVAIVNYTNLATAQSLGRAREVGLRKTMGAARVQLLQQFLVESLTIAAISMLIAMALLEICVPLFNTAVDRALTINYAVILPWLVVTTLVVGLVAGAYPAYLITRVTPIEALRDEGAKGAKGSIFRSIMLGLQFAISIFMLAMVLIVYAQNLKIENSSNIFPRSQIVTLQRLGVESIRSRHETLRNEISKIPGVENFTYSSQVPYEGNQSLLSVGPVEGEEASSFTLLQIFVDENFMKAYDIPLLAGRDLSNDIGGDTLTEGVLSLNVIVNEMLVEKLGIGFLENSISEIFYDFPSDRGEETRASRAYTIVGVVPDQNFLGFYNQIKPMVYLMDPEAFRIASVRVKGAGMMATLKEIEAVWDDLVPEYPIQAVFLDETFQDVFQVFSAMAKVMGGFAFLALTLSLIGLFGLAAFMVQGRTKEIGIRKVMGANMSQIIKLLVWQFSKPVLWALPVALPMAYMASGLYLDFFADRLTMPAGIIFAAGVLAIAFAWGIVAIHAVTIARKNPINALRYE